MSLIITPFYGSLLILFYLGLGLKVVHLRRTLKVGVGHGNKKELERAIRVHGNFQEYIPLSLLMLLFLELTACSQPVLHIYGILLIFARSLHALGLKNSAGYSQKRFIGTALNYLLLISGSLYFIMTTFIDVILP